MIIGVSAPGTIQIKLKDNTIELGEAAKVGEFELTGPGEYEIGGIEAVGVGKLYIFEAEEMRLAYLDRLNRPLNDEEQTAASDVDILFVPIGGNGVLDAKGALAVINQLDPRVVIPMYYEDISEFTKEEGVEPEHVDSLKITRATLPETERKIIVLPWKQSKKS